MDLLQSELQNNKNRDNEKKKKIVLFFIIIFTIIFFILLAIISLMPTSEENKTLSVYINDTKISNISNIIAESTNGNVYVSLSDIAKLTNYNYFNGEYLVYTEDKNQCYLENDYQIVGFEVDTDKIYKIINKKTQDELYQYYTLVNPVISNNEKLYVELQDFRNSM